MAAPRDCMTDVLTIFKRVQETQANHQKNAVFLQKLYEKKEPDKIKRKIKKVNAVNEDQCIANIVDRIIPKIVHLMENKIRRNLLVEDLSASVCIVAGRLLCCQLIDCVWPQRNLQGSSRTDPDIKKFKFPVGSPIISQQWVKNSGNFTLLDLTEKILKTRFVCDVHFKEEELTNRYFCPGSIPIPSNQAKLEHDFSTFFHSIKKAIFVTVLNTEDFKPSNVYVNRIVLFIGIFCKTLKASNEKNKENKNTIEDEVEECTEDPLITEMSEFLLKASQTASDTMRYRSCQVINVILDSLTGMCFSEELSENLKEYLLDRLQDSKMPIKLHGILALNRLQDAHDPDDEIIKEFVELMTHDSSAKVRKMCVEKVALRSDVLEAILLRVRDVDDNVKMAAMQKLAKHAKALTISQKHIMLTMGFLENLPKVNSFFTSTILPTWLESYDNQILTLMKRVRLGCTTKDIERMIHFYKKILKDFYFKISDRQSILGALPLSEEKLMSFEDLNWETVSYLRILAEYLKGSEMEDIFEQILPDAVVFCKYIKKYLSSTLEELDTDDFIEKQFIIKQFFLITKLFDYSDPASRDCFLKLIVFMLQNVDLMEDVTDTIVSNIELIYPNSEKRCNFVCEIISEIFCPLDADDALKEYNEKEFQLSKLKVKINILLEEKEQAIKNEEFEDAARIKNELHMAEKELIILREKEPDEVKRKMDVPTLTKCLDIACALLERVRSAHLPVSMKSFKNEIVQDQELLINENDIIKCKALRFYSMCALLDKPTAEIGIHMFAIPIIKYQEDSEFYTQILIVCMKAVVDLLRVYGTNLITEPAQGEDAVGEDSMNEENRRIFTGGVSLTKLIKGLVDLMEDEVYEVRETAVLGLCKLVLSERIKSAPLIAKLVLKWLNPEIDDEDISLKQLIGHFLEQVPYLPSSLELLEGAFISTINSLFKAPKNEPLATVDIDNIAKFLLALCKTSRHGPEIHSNIARSLCIKINERPRCKINSQYAKILLMLHLPENPGSVQEIEGLCEQILDAVSDKTTITNITKFRAKLAERRLENSDVSTIAETKVEPIKNEIED